MVCSATRRRGRMRVAPEDVLLNNGSAPRGYFSDLFVFTTTAARDGSLVEFGLEEGSEPVASVHSS